jgi:hypothetical protein
MNGGTDIVAYQMQMDDGNNGDFFDILSDTLDTEVIVSTGIT